MRKNNPLVSIVIVNWNGKEYLNACLQSIFKSSYKNVEVIVVDQGSKDGSQELLKKKFAKVKLIENKDNTGYVGGNNLGIKRAKGKYILILNNDVVVNKSFLEPLIDAFENDRRLGCAQPKALNLREKGKLDGGGSFFTITGFLNHYGYLENANDEKFNKRYPVYSVKGAYMFTRRDLYRKLGGLDKDFFIYFEETDFCARIWLSGHTVEYIPQSIVSHWGGGDTKEEWSNKFALIQYRSFRNRICSYLKNLSPQKLTMVLPIHLALCELLSLYAVLTLNFKFCFAIQKAIFWNIKFIRNTLKKRKFIQSKIRKISDSNIFSLVEKNKNLNYYFHSLFLVLYEKDI